MTQKYFAKIFQSLTKLGSNFFFSFPFLLTATIPQDRKLSGMQTQDIEKDKIHVRKGLMAIFNQFLAIRHCHGLRAEKQRM